VSAQLQLTGDAYKQLAEQDKQLKLDLEKAQQEIEVGTLCTGTSDHVEACCA